MSIAASRNAIPDVQGTADLRQIAIDKVGVKDVTYPMRLRMPPSHGGGEQGTVASISMYVSLPHHQKGTHMSRFVEVLNEHTGALTPQDIPGLTRAIRERLHAADAHFECSFTYFIQKLAPVTGQPGLMDYKVSFRCSVGGATGEEVDFIMGVMAPATSLCPCSKEISRFGAHNQRCHIEAKVRMDPAKPILWIEELVKLLEGAASTEVFAVLKRPDEKYVTEAAYENPKFVEDLVRDVALRLNAEPRIGAYSVDVENFESIHNHSAYARIERGLQLA